MEKAKKTNYDRVKIYYQALRKIMRETDSPIIWTIAKEAIKSARS